MRHAIRLMALGFLSALALSACTDKPVAKPGIKVGKPYVINGKTYYPEYDPTYDKIGEASWYGPGFHGKMTANGEIFNQDDLTAAHPTLPMPSIVRVTNLSNGKSLLVRVNDRGPFKANRIIDLSRKSAQRLGIKGLAKVRVQFLKEDTENYIASIQNGGKQVIDMFAYNDRIENTRTNTMLASTAPAGQIVESTVSRTQAGQTVTDAAPIMTVASDDIAGPAPQSPAAAEDATIITVSDSSAPARDPQSSRFIRQAWADDNAGMPVPPDDAPQTAEKEEKKEQDLNALGPSARGTQENLYIQAGSFAEEANAQKLSQRLSDIARVSVGKVMTADRTWWRVRLGPFADQETASGALESVRAAGLPDARLIHQ